MGSLILVRHGQASFFADDYDQLSEVGRTQACLLGQFWTRRGLAFDEVYTGPRTRQQQTADLVGAECSRAGSCWPAPVVLPELDEYDLAGLLHRLAPELARQDGAFAAFVEGYRRSEDDLSRVKNFQRAFEALTVHWVTAAPSLPGLESWPAFRERVQRCLRHLMNRPGRGRRVALFTSGGFIGAAMQQAL